jgi:menaquinone-specific isochorismate synthase
LLVVELLHPTPALGGKPRDLAMDVIRESETAPRGWYAAPIGWIDYQLDGVFSVAIRSAVSQEKRVWMYAGAGIVGDSIPQKEWDETALKFRPMLNALGLEEQIDVRA